MFKRKLSKNIKSKRSRAITFKTALFIVLGLHAVAYFGFVQWSSHRAKQARLARAEEMQKRMTDQNKTKETVWPSQGSPKVVAQPKPQLPLNVASEINTLIDSFNKVVSFTAEQREKLTASFSKATTEQQQQLRVILNAAVTEEQKKNIVLTIKSAITETKQPSSIKTEPQPARKPVLQTPKQTRVVKTQSYSKPTHDKYSNEDIIISPSTVKTYVSNGIHYISSEMVSSRVAY
jgi:hypothetical protein